jgi:hypothetical protein
VSVWRSMEKMKHPKQSQGHRIRPTLQAFWRQVNSYYLKCKTHLIRVAGGVEDGMVVHKMEALGAALPSSVAHACCQALTVQPHGLTPDTELFSGDSSRAELAWAVSVPLIADPPVPAFFTSLPRAFRLTQSMQASLRRRRDWPTAFGFVSRKFPCSTGHTGREMTCHPH